MTIPTLVTRYKERQTIVKLKQTYSMLSQAILLSEQEYGQIASWNAEYNTSGAKILGSRIKPFLKLAHDCGIKDTHGICIYSARYKYLRGVESVVNYASSGTYYKLMLLNGVSVFMRGNPGTTVAHFFIDINGPKQPNQWGVDTFLFTYTEGSGLKPYGSIDGCLQSLSSNIGNACTFYVLKNENMDYLHNK